MKKFLYVFVCLLCVLSVSMAMAKENSKKKAPKAESGAELIVAEKECQALMAYQPSADTEYQPGVNVHGKPVMEADVTPSVIKPPDTTTFDLAVDVAKYNALPVQAGVISEAKVGTITVEKGQVKFNGTPLEGEEVATLKAICASQKHPKPVK